MFKDPILYGALFPAPGLTLDPDLANRKVGDYYLTKSGQGDLNEGFFLSLWGSCLPLFSPNC